MLFLFQRAVRVMLAGLTVFVVASVLNLKPMPATVTWAQGGDQADARLKRLAGATGHAADRLQIADEVSVPLLNGQRVSRMKAVDQATGEIVGASFIGDKVVDEAALRAQAAGQWRAAHGALTPDLVQKLAALRPGDTLDIAIWLVADTHPLPKPDSGRPAGPAAGEQNTANPANVPAVPAPVEAGQAKPLAVPVPPEEAPAEVIRLLDLPPEPAQLAPLETPKSDEEIEQQQANAPSPVLPSDMTAAQAQAFDAQNLASIKAQVAPVQAQFQRLLQGRALSASYSSQIAPMVYIADISREQVEGLAFLPEIDAIYVVENIGGPSLSVARPTQNADLINSVGYNGNGVNVAVVEGERISNSNPYLNVIAIYNSSAAVAVHPTGVGGIIASTHSTYRGLASGARIYGANGSYSDFGVMSAALDWGSTNATVLNNSYWWQDNGSSSSLFTLDRHMDYIVRTNFDFAAVASGNFAGSTSYVATPGKGYNAFTVGNFDDFDSLSWSGDSMASDSSYGDPGWAKPEVAAVGSGIQSTTPSSPWVGGIGSGTSYASPMVAALAADLIGANNSLSNDPEVIRSIIMATALHNIEGNARLSDRDGVGAIDATAALATLERGNWDDRSISSSTTFPITFNQFAYKGERVRFVINWLSNPNDSYTTDSLPADLDLAAYRSDGTTFIASSASFNNNFEIVDFIAPASETYVFRVSLFGSWSGGLTWLGSAWWRGVYRISPDTGYSDPVATPLGTHLAIYPTDWSPTNYWRGFAIRPQNSDHDLALYSASWFDDPSTRNLLASSALGGAGVDFTMVDGNHRSAGLAEQYRVNKFSGTGGYAVSWSSPGIVLGAPGLYGPYTMSSSQVIKVFDVLFAPGRLKRISIVPTTAANDLAAHLFRSNAGTPSSWTQGRGSYVAVADAFGAGSSVERLSYAYIGDSSDYLGLAVTSKENAAASFYVQVEDVALVYLPLVLK